MGEQDLRKLIKIYLFMGLKEKFKESPFNICDAAFLLQGSAGFLGSHASAGIDAYKLVAWDILGCIEEDGHIVKFSHSSGGGLKPWRRNCSWKIKHALLLEGSGKTAGGDA